MLKTALLAGALLCLPAALAEAARLTSAPLTLGPSDIEEPPLAVAEKITCSVHYSGPGIVRGTLRLVYNGLRGGGPELSLLPADRAITLSPTDRNHSVSTIRVGDWPIEEVVCDLNFPGVTNANQFRALLCIADRTNPAVRAVSCVSVY